MVVCLYQKIHYTKIYTKQSHNLSQQIDINSIYAKTPMETFFLVSPIPVRIFVDHVKIFNSSPMQHLSWSSL